MRIRLDDEHPDVDFARQQRICDDVDAGRLTHEQHNHLVRASWPPCCCCGNIASLTINQAFYCDGCGQLAWQEVRDAAR